MNIDDVKTFEIPAYHAPSFVTDVLRRQHHLAKKYKDIETKNGFWHPYDQYPHLNWLPGPVESLQSAKAVPVDDPHVQHWLKEMFWRATEEIAEALEELPPQGFKNWREQYESNVTIRHVLEELADAVHFIAEASIIAGIDQDKVNHFWFQLETTPVSEEETDMTYQQFHMFAWAMRPVRAMGLAANCLKNKPWKTTQMPTDRAKFVDCVEQVWYEMAALFKFLGLKREDVFVLYFKKSEVNKFRQATQY